MIKKNRVKIVTDSSCDLPKGIVEFYNIGIIGNRIKIGESYFVDNRYDTSDGGKLYDYINNRRMYFMALPIEEETYEEFIKNELLMSDNILFIGSSMCSPISYENLSNVAKEFSNVTVFDAANISAGIGELVEKAASMAKIGFMPDKISEQLDKYVGKIRAAFINKEMYEINSEVISSGSTNEFFMSFKIENKTTIPEKRYDNNWENAVYGFVNDFMRDRDNMSPKRLFISYISCDKATVDLILQEVEAFEYFSKVVLVEASLSTAYISGMESFGFYGTYR